MSQIAKRTNVNTYKQTAKRTNVNTYKQGDVVIIHSLGDNDEYEGEINGISVDFGTSGPNIWIVKILSTHGTFKNHKFTHFCVTGACLRLK